MLLIFRLIFIISLHITIIYVVEAKQVGQWNGKEDGGRIYFYTEPYHGGNGYVLDLGFKGACFRINPQRPAGLTSVDTNGACAYLFDDDSCGFKNRWVKVRRYSYESNDLSVVGLAGKVQSVRSCSAFLVPVYLYTDTNFNGVRLRLDVYARAGCTNLARSERETVRKSILLNDPASCVILYSYINCLGKGIRIQGSCAPAARDLGTVDFARGIYSLQTCKAAHVMHARRGNTTIEYKKTSFQVVQSSTNHVIE